MRRLLLALPAVLLLTVGQASSWGEDGPAQPAARFDLRAFGRLPILFNGRVTDFNHYARNALLRVSGNETWLDTEGKTQSAVAWLLEVMSDSDAFRSAPVVLVEHPAVRTLFELPAGIGGQRVPMTDLIPKLEARGFQPVIFRLNAESSMREKDRLPDQLREVVAPGFILLDGAEQLSTRHWLSVRGAAAKAAGFIVTVHRSSRLPVALELESNVKVFESLVTELCGGKLPGEEAYNIFLRHRGNVRECFRELYDRWNG